MPEFDVDSVLQSGGVLCPGCGHFVVAYDDAHDEGGATYTGETTWDRALSGGETMHMPVMRHKCPACAQRVYVCYKPVATTLLAGREAEMDAPEETTAHYLRVASKPECADCGECTDIEMRFPVEGEEGLVSRYECNNCGCFWDVAWEVDTEFKP